MKAGEIDPIEVHLLRYPLMGAEDLYKLVHQAVFGSEHAVPDPTTARRWLEEELAALGPAPVDHAAVDHARIVGRWPADHAAIVGPCQVDEAAATVGPRPVHDVGAPSSEYDAPASVNPARMEEAPGTSGPSPLVEPLIDPISRDGTIARVHLRPYLAAGRDPEMLLQAFVRTANDHCGSAPEFQSAIERGLELAGRLRPSIDAERLRRILEDLGGRGFPAIHHSPAYLAAYAPAYRVVKVAYLS